MEITPKGHLPNQNYALAIPNCLAVVKWTLIFPPLPPFRPPLSGWARWLPSVPTPHSRWVTPVEQYLRGLCSRQAWWTQWTLEQPPVPLSGILYELGQSQQDQDLQCEATVKGTSGLVANRLTNLQAARNQSAQQVRQNPFCIYTL